MKNEIDKIPFSDDEIAAANMQQVTVAAACALKKPAPLLFGSIKDSAQLAAEFEIEMSLRRAGVVRHVNTGFASFDSTFPRLLFNGELSYVAGRPGTGKTTFLVHLGENIADSGKSVLFFSIEMTGLSVLERSVVRRSGINMQQMRDVHDVQLTDEQEGRLQFAIGAVRDSRIMIDSSTRDVNDLVEKTISFQKHCAEKGLPPLACVLVDYIQKMTDKSKKFGARHEEVESISGKLLELAKQINVPVIVASQLNRGLEGRPNKRPMLSDLRDSGGIEQDAHVVLGIYRDELYNPDTPHKGVAEILGMKYRNGAPNTVAQMRFIGERFMFAELEGTPSHPQQGNAKKQQTHAKAYGNALKGGTYGDDW